MNRWKLSFEEYGRLPVTVYADMLLVMSVEDDVATAIAAKAARKR